MDIQKIQERFEDLMLANPDFDESLLEKDEEGCYVDSDIANMYGMFEMGTEIGEAWQAAKANAVHECTWSPDQNEEMWGNWHTSCGEIFTLNEGTPTEHKLNHCCYCGGLLIEAQEPSHEE